MAPAALRHCRLLSSSPISPFVAASDRRDWPHTAALRTLFPTRIKNPFRALCTSSGGDGRSPALAAETSSEIHIYNTMTKKKELFRPRVPGKVGMYVCGVTAYDLSHIGHARVYVTFDVLYRYLQHLDYEVCYVRNFTDIDDKET